MRRARFLSIVLVAFVAMTAIVAVRAFLPGDNADFARGERVMPVAVASVPSVEFADVVEALGTARANETVTITARVTDTISRINFESGQRVAAGAILVELTDTEEAAGLTEARSTLGEAQREFDRTSDLITRGVVPQSRLDEATAAVQRARARVASIEAQLADRMVRRNCRAARSQPGWSCASRRCDRPSRRYQPDQARLHRSGAFSLGGGSGHGHYGAFVCLSR